MFKPRCILTPIDVMLLLCLLCVCLTPAQARRQRWGRFEGHRGYCLVHICPIWENRRLGGAQPGNRFVPFVRAYARSGCLVELDLKLCWPDFSLFPFGPGWSWGFSFVGPGGPGELSLFPFGPRSFPFSLPPPPKPPIQL